MSISIKENKLVIKFQKKKRKAQIVSLVNSTKHILTKLYKFFSLSWNINMGGGGKQHSAYSMRPAFS